MGPGYRVCRGLTLPLASGAAVPGHHGFAGSRPIGPRPASTLGVLRAPAEEAPQFCTLNRTWSYPMLTLYYAPHTCALASHIALEDAAAAYKLERIDFARAQQQSAEYLRVNPKARVPALVTAGGVITETPAILAFVAQSFPSAGLAPLQDPFAFAEYNPSTVTCAQPCTLRTRIGCVAIAGPTSPRRSPTCSAKCRSR